MKASGRYHKPSCWIRWVDDGPTWSLRQVALESSDGGVVVKRRVNDEIELTNRNFLEEEKSLDKL